MVGNGSSYVQSFIFFMFCNISVVTSFIIIHQHPAEIYHPILAPKRICMIDKHIDIVDDDDEEEACNPHIIHRHNNKMILVSRRTSLVSSALGIATSILRQYPVIAADSDISSIRTFTDDVYHERAIPSLTIPLQYQPKLSAYTLSYQIGKSKFGAIIDTGSPFLLVPAASEASCSPEYQWGCFHPEESKSTSLEPTLERFDGNEGLVEWREGPFSFDIQSKLFPNSLMTFGVISESLMNGPGGIFLGLVKNTDKRIRPSFLSQSNVSAFKVDLREREGINKSLTLYGPSTGGSSSNLPNERDAIPLVRDLNKRFGDPTIHYVGVASSINVNGNNLATTSRRSKIYCIFDTGCSGMTISPSLFDQRYASARANREKNLWGSVNVELQTLSGKIITLNANRPITTPLGDERPWGKRLDGHLIVLGLSFLEGLKMTVDIDGDKIWFEDT